MIIMNTILIEKKQQLQNILKEYKEACQKSISYKELLKWERCYPEFASEIVALHSRLCLERLRGLHEKDLV